MIDAKIETGVRQSFDAHDSLAHALNALDAVRDLCIEAGNGQPEGSGMHLVDADHFASLLGIILKEMRTAQAAL